MTKVKLYSITTLILFFILFSGFAQNIKSKSNLLSLAKIEISNLRYSYAIPFLKRYVNDYKLDSVSANMLANCYKMQNRLDSAIYFYEKLNEIKAIYTNDLAELYASVGQYDKAILTYRNLLTLQNDKTSALYAMYENRLNGFLTRSKFNQNSLDYKVRYLTINTSFNEFGAAFLDSGFVFESNRGRKITRNNEFGWDGLPFTKLYYQVFNEKLETDTIIYAKWNERVIKNGLSDKTNQTVNDNRTLDRQFDLQKLNSTPNIESPLFESSLSGKYNFGSITFTADGKQAFYTKNQTNSKGIKQLEIWSISRFDNIWGNPIKLFFNNPNFSYFHPAITSNGDRLYFVSDQPGGFGGTDIYYVNKKEDGTWDATTNAGSLINTAGNELFPTYYEGNLYFSSNGHEGLGGLDIFKLSNLKVENIGKPINSEKDDLGFSIRNGKGLFTSNRFGSDDIFSYSYNIFNVTIKGIVTVDGVKKSGTKVFLKSTDDNTKNSIFDSTTTNENGIYSFIVKPNRKYQIFILDTNGNKSIQDVDLLGYVNSNKDLGQFNLITPKKEEKINISNKRTFASVVDSLITVTNDFVIVHHEFDRVEIVKEDKKIYSELQQKLIKIHGAKVVIVSATDCIGSDSYNEALSSRRTQKIKKDLEKIRGNQFVLMPIGEKQLVMGCAESEKDKIKQVTNRYSYVFIIK